MASKARQKVSRVSLPDHIPLVGGKLPPVQGTETYINRELSWLEFNARVLAEAASDEVPLFERLKFLSIFASNLDEFFMVRVAGLQAQRHGNVTEQSPDRLSPEAQLSLIARRAHDLCETHSSIWLNQVHPALRAAGLGTVSPDELSPEGVSSLSTTFEANVFPVLTPIAIDPAHPFPHLRNKNINVCFRFEQRDRAEPAFGIVQLPASLPRLVPVTMPNMRTAFVTLEEVIFRQAARLFPNQPLLGYFAFRVTRNFDIDVDEDEGEDLLLTIQTELRKRERGQAVRLEISGEAPRESVQWLCDELELNPELDVYTSQAPLMLDAMAALTRGEDLPEYKDPPFSPVYVPPLRDSEDFFETIRAGDVLLHHPYESFEAVIDFVMQAAEDPDVLAIKQTLYRTGGESPLVRALQRAAELGKQVTAVVELKARFDEASNIQWARALERSGVNVMYGLLGFKTHAKVLLVVRREGDVLRRYVHLSTGNYNQQTARLYADMSLFTARDDIGEDVTSLFNLLTGYSAPARWRQLLLAPLGLHEAMLGFLHREKTHAENGRPAYVIAKMNSLVDPDIIAGLYAASNAGVRIDLLVRGICCLRPGVPGLSENIRVLAQVDRFLEHARIFYFENGGSPEVYLGSSDWMPRNFRRRVETVFPILDPKLQHRVRHEILELMLTDNQKTWQLEPDGSYRRVPVEEGEPPRRSQSQFIEDARALSRGSQTTLKTQRLRPAPRATSVYPMPYRKPGGRDEG
ncbi:MAG: polyphosphate kinase 1 [Sorangiineae bacterium NIC37A_2]|jgi:polyphosphate kinase|nr:MAG: polyphosphate kinase 1 [Sorangiineae bacterium NIC37A_2]